MTAPRVLAYNPEGGVPETWPWWGAPLLCLRWVHSHALERPAIALHHSPRCGVLLSGGWAPLAATHAALPAPGRARLRLHPGPLSAHDLLMAGCAAALHHGGSGTTAAGLAAGTPQVVAPLQFDQPFWAERLAHLGMSPPPLDARVLFAGDECTIADAAATIASRLLESVESSTVRSCCKEMAASLQVGV